MPAPLAVFGLSVQELLVILAILVVLFGARKIPEIARGLGEGIRGFRSSLKGGDESEDAGNADSEQVTKTHDPQ
jgi:sec-independent protein translocase protein TatA